LSNAARTERSVTSTALPRVGAVHASIMCAAAAVVQSPMRSLPYIGQSVTAAARSISGGGGGSFVRST
jgi:hypothetical protein